VDVDFAFICDYAETTQKVNALGIGFDKIYTAKLPVRHAHFHVVAQVRFSLTEVGLKEMEVRLIDADGGNVVPPIQGRLEVPTPMPKSLDATGRLNVGFGNVQFKEYGRYSVRVTIQGREMVSIPFMVIEPPKTD